MDKMSKEGKGDRIAKLKELLDNQGLTQEEYDDEKAKILAEEEFDLNKQIERVSNEVNGKNKVVAGILALLVGGLGIHKFYLGRPGMGIVYLLFCWSGIPSILGFIEGIIYLVSSDAEFNAKYGANPKRNYENMK